MGDARVKRPFHPAVQITAENQQTCIRLQRNVSNWSSIYPVLSFVCILGEIVQHIKELLIRLISGRLSLFAA